MFFISLGTGKGGTSVWGRKFEDEFHDSLKAQYITFTTCL